MTKRKVCVVIQRYGEEVNGGAEALARLLAESLVKCQNWDVEVATTKAVDYVTWKDYYKNDEETLNGVKIHRFGVRNERNEKYFNKVSARVLTTPVSTAEQEEWMRLQGPESPLLIKWLKDNKDNFDCFIVICYLYYSTYFAMKEIADKAIFIPTAHEERPIHLSIFEKMFDSTAGFYFLTPEEKELVNKLFPSSLNKPDNGGRGGCGIEISEKVSPEAFRKKFNIEGDFMIYAGRIDENKCVNELFDYFAEYKKRNPKSDVKLVLIGKEIIKVPKRKDIISLGFVDEQDKYDGMAAAKFLVLPSKFESLSIVVLEAMGLNKPVLVSGGCEVLKGHCRRSNAGLYYNDYYEFEGCMNYLFTKDDITSQMGANGVKYVADYYTWQKLTDAMEDGVKEVLSKNEESDEE